MGGTIPETGTVTEIKLWHYGSRESGTPDPQCNVSVDGQAQVAQNAGLTTSNAWHSNTFLGSWNLATGFDTLLTSFISGLHDKDEDLTIYSYYWEVTYSDTPPSTFVPRLIFI